MSDAANQWTKFYTENTEIMYPAEAVIRIFKGTYPNLKMPKPKARDAILDVGFGDGRHFPLFASLGMRLAGSEISQEIVDAVAGRMSFDTYMDLRVGTCGNLPWENGIFDFLMAWNSCYYMNSDADFRGHVTEMARVIKPGGWIVCSVPKASCFIFKDCEEMNDLYVTIRDDHFGLRNGEVMRRLRSTEEVEAAFAPGFTNFCHADIDIDMFGLAYNWHVFVAERRA